MLRIILTSTFEAQRNRAQAPIGWRRLYAIRVLQRDHASLSPVEDGIIVSPRRQRMKHFLLKWMFPCSHFVDLDS
jgi:hypothetical protein